MSIEVVNSHDRAPSITSAAAVDAAENQTAVIDVQSTDPDGETENGGGLTYSLTGGADQALFSIDTNTGVLTFVAAPDFENPTDAGGNNVYDVQVTVTDAGGLTGVQAIAVTVTDVTEIADAVIFATNSVSLNGNILTGDVLVNDATGKLTVEIGSITTAGFDLKADDITINIGAVVDADVFFNTLTNQGVINGNQNTPLSVPLFGSGELPAFNQGLACGLGFEDISVKKNQSRAVAPGDYGVISAKGEIIFTAVADGVAIYNVCSVDLSKGGKWLFNDAGFAGVQFDVRVEDFLDTDKDGVVGPITGANIDASDIVIYVAGTGPNVGSSDLDAVASIGKNNTVNANIFAKNGILDIGKGTVATGAFFAEDVVVLADTVLTLDSFLNGS